MDHRVVSTRYFLSFSGYEIPFCPSEEVTEAVALARKSYYIGRYAQGLLITFEKVLDGKRSFLDEYEYWPGSKQLQHRRMVKEDGSVLEQEFDRRGKLIKGA